ncbi:SLC13 family permease [Thiocystis violascens]|uniref:Na+/H+ antiporter NhaD-like permease n=1 Tax=Thiocystis violascens (strain ATCC 17096 / DSM 198 / 6111) TaxID=765911 RepID=I3YFG9_THIV6|nr:anion transporter [Thiocystis violascens]AFL75737.1 Na+/H+ antiporter NhaD-like permease [Thiocystis violascens DSM 198]
MTFFVVTVFLLVYLGMLLGGLPFLQLDRTGVVLLGAIALVASETVPMDQVWRAIHLPTLALLFSFMVISAQLRLGGFYGWAVGRLGRLDLSPPALLGALIAVAAGLSAVFSNDIVCLAMAPVLVEVCLDRRLDPIPYLLSLACAANVGSAATLIGNPQNMLIGETLALSFAEYLLVAAIPVMLGLIVTWGIVAGLTRGRWQLRASPPEPPTHERTAEHWPTLNRWQSIKGLTVATVLFAGFLFIPWPRALMALAGAALLLTSRRLHSFRMLGLVDWQLLVLFIGLFIVNHALQQTGLPAQAVAALATQGVDLHAPTPLFVTSFLLSNLVSNVPAVMLLLPVATDPISGPLLALSSTLAGNLLIVGSIANIIVIQAADRRGIRIDWRGHARIGVPVTLATLAIAALALWLGQRLDG